MEATKKPIKFAKHKPVYNYMFILILAMITCSFFVPGTQIIHYNDLCIYKNPGCNGDLTSSIAENKFQNLDVTGKLFCVDSAAFNGIIDRAGRRKYSPMKLHAANHILFCYGRYNNKQDRILIANSKLIIDYQTRVIFIVSKTEDTVYLKNLINWVNQ